MAEIEPKEEKSFFTDGLSVLFLTIYGYIAVYFYEAGYCHAFKIPVEFINPSINNLLYVGALSIGLFGIFYQIFDTIFMVSKNSDNKSPYARVFLKHVFLILIGLYISHHTYFYWVTVVFFLAFPLLNFLIDIVSPIFSGFKNYKENLESWLNSQVNNPTKNIHNSLEKSKHRSTLSIILLGIYGVAFLSNYGYGVALRKTEFPVIESHILLKIYGSNAIGAKLDKDKNLISNDYKIIKLENIDFSLQETGELRVNKK